MKHIFVSYAREDKNFAAELCRRLRASRLTPWQDLRNLRGGDDWQAVIDDALRSAEVLVVVMSPRATRSQYVTYEWAFALGAGVRVIPVIHKSTPLHPRLDALYYVDFTARPGRPWVDLWKALPKRSPRTASEPEIFARFALQNGKPESDQGYYAIYLSVRQPPRNTRYVTYELNDETLARRKWSSKAASTNFESIISSNGDLLVTAEFRTPARRRFRIGTTLYEALRRGHGTSPTESVRSALSEIKEWGGA